jgi:3-hydroxyacyl-CoA dehydrogenase
MQIGIIGAGKIGGTVGRLWAKAGHKVQFATRHPDETQGLGEGHRRERIGRHKRGSGVVRRGGFRRCTVQRMAGELANIERGEGRGGCRQPRPRPRRQNG